MLEWWWWILVAQSPGSSPSADKTWRSDRVTCQNTPRALLRYPQARYQIHKPALGQLNPLQKGHSCSIPYWNGAACGLGST